MEREQPQNDVGSVGEDVVTVVEVKTLWAPFAAPGSVEDGAVSGRDVYLVVLELANLTKKKKTYHLIFFINLAKVYLKVPTQKVILLSYNVQIFKKRKMSSNQQNV